MARALIPFVIAPLLALAIIAAVGEGVAAAILGLAGAGILGGAGAWLAFGGRRHHPVAAPSTATRARRRSTVG